MRGSNSATANGSALAVWSVASDRLPTAIGATACGRSPGARGARGCCGGISATRAVSVRVSAYGSTRTRGSDGLNARHPGRQDSAPRAARDSLRLALTRGSARTRAVSRTTGRERASAAGSARALRVADARSSARFH
jgi:hypothetical protein